MSIQKRKVPISIIFILSFISNSFVLISAQLIPRIDFKLKCPKMFYCHPDDARFYLRCVPNFGLVKLPCAKGLLFNSVINACDWPQNSNCKGTTTTDPTLTSQEPYKITVTTARTTRKWENAKPCDPNTCKLPNCKCPDDQIPGSFEPKNVPQMVMLTFDDGVNPQNIEYFQKLHQQNLTNPDGCPAAFTFFVSGNNNNYQFVEQLYRQGHEIASHSVTHRFPISWWKNAGYKELENEMVGMRDLLTKKSHIPAEKLKGARIPFLQIGGDNLYRVLKNNNFTWDSSMLARTNTRPVWPFTLDSQVTSSVCQIEPCPINSYPGLWEVPLIQWRDSNGTLYGMPDENMKPKTKSEMFDFLRENFDLHYKSNRAPFGIFIHATWFKKKDFNLEVLQDFLKYLNEKKDVWVIPVTQAVDWVRTPKPISSLSEIPSWNCTKKTIAPSKNNSLAKTCDPNTCKLPNCKCPDDQIPGSFEPKNVPQMVMLTFDDGVNPQNIEYFQKLHQQNLTNPDGCPASFTFFVSGNNNNYQLVEQLYRQGHEIASHSVTHRFPISWWKNAGYKELENEMVGMRDLLTKKSHIPAEKLKGARIPFLQIGGDNLYQVFKNNKFTWDSSMLARTNTRPVWPFTLDSQVTSSVCQIGPCPKNSYPGLWEVPLIQWRDSNGTLYGMPDENMKPKTKSEMFDFFRENFDLHYKSNRAPFGIFIHATWFKKKDFNLEVLQDFLKYLNEKKDVWVIPVTQAVDWVRTPKPISSLSEIPSWNCTKKTIAPSKNNSLAKPCDPNTCKLPNCKCPDDQIPGSFEPKNVPQMVMLTFDDGVNPQNIEYFQKLHQQNLTNPDGCPAAFTFFVSGNNNNYQLVEQLYRQGHEIASHSVTHRFPISWWKNAGYKELENEMVGMRDLLTKKSHIPAEKLKGARIPFLQIGGDNLYRVLKNNFTWDSSMLARTNTRPVWPFTLDSQVTSSVCQIGPCPKNSYPGLWEVPLIQWRDSNGTLYGMPDENMKPKTKSEMFDFFRENFDLHYKSNRAPFGIFIHATWFKKKDFNLEVLQDFLKYLNEKKDVWVIPVTQAVDWVRTPKPISSLSEIPSWNCTKKTIAPSKNNSLAKPCDPNTCKLPNCKCPDDQIPGSLKPKSVPQMVMLTFDDYVNPQNIEYFKKLHQQNLTNSDGCPAAFTFFVSGNNNNYQLVEQLYRQGHEIASHSITHRFPISWWKNTGYKELENEMVGMRDLLTKKSHIPAEKLKGARIPFLQIGGDNLYRVLKNNFTWDSSMLARTNTRPVWPFTLDSQVTSSVCQIGPCPKNSYPGLWEVPLIQWRDSNGKLYGMPDENMKPKTKSEMFDFFRENFDLHYKSNRAPFGIFIHATWFKKKDFNLEVLQDFLKYLNEKKDVWVIPVTQAVDWVRTPKPISSLSEIPSWNCNKKT